jgi:hypothetical protein
MQSAASFTHGGRFYWAFLQRNKHCVSNSALQLLNRNDANTARFPLLQPTGMKFVSLRRSFVLRQATRGSKINKINRAVPGGAWTAASDLDLETCAPLSQQHAAHFGCGGRI